MFDDYRQGQKFGENPRIHSRRDSRQQNFENQMDCRKYFSSSYKVIWQESMDSCKIPLRESKWLRISDPDRS